MKKLLTISFVIVLSTLVCFSQPGGSVKAEIGVKTVTSFDNQYLLITKCDPESQADIAGLESGDHIYLINDKKISDLKDPSDYLVGPPGTNVKLSIKRYDQGDYININVTRISGGTDLIKYKSYYVNRYATEKRIFTIEPYRWDMGVTTCMNDNTKDLFKFRTYDFEYTSTEDPLQEKLIFNEFGRQLNLMGMTRSEVKPDLLILMSFYSGKEEQYIPPQQIVSTKIKNVYNWYWGVVPVAVTNTTTKEGYKEVKYLANINIKILDANEIETSKTLPVVWTGSISSVSKEPTFLTDKSKDFFTVMLDQFPEVTQINSIAYNVLNYFYTGLVYDLSDKQIIGGVIPGSPAETSGIKKGDKILSINGRTLPSKNLNLVFGKSGSNKKGSALNYMFAFDGKSTPDIIFEIERNGEKRSIDVTPIIKCRILTRTH
jgi:membrane-associated protease RseP (regulator of RpoE activity)